MFLDMALPVSVAGQLHEALSADPGHQLKAVTIGQNETFHGVYQADPANPAARDSAPSIPPC